MMIPAGDPVDTAILAIKPHLQSGDILIDGGNSYFEDTERRAKNLPQRDCCMWAWEFLVERAARCGDPALCPEAPRMPGSVSTP